MLLNCCGMHFSSGRVSREVNYITMCLHNCFCSCERANVITGPISFSQDLQHSLSYLQHFEGRWKILFPTHQLSAVAKTCTWLLSFSQLGFWRASLRLIQSVIWVRAAPVICFTCCKKVLQRWFPRDLMILSCILDFDLFIQLENMHVSWALMFIHQVTVSLFNTWHWLSSSLAALDKLGFE